MEVPNFRTALLALAVLFCSGLCSMAAESIPPSEMAFYARMTRALAPEEEAQALAFVRRFSPEQLPSLESLKIQALPRYNFMIRRLLWFEKQLAEIQGKGDTAAYRRDWNLLRRMFLLQTEAEALAIRYRNTSDPQVRASLRSQLTDQLTVLFDMREQMKRDEIERLTKELERLRSIVEERQQNKNAIIERRVKLMIGELDATEW